MRSLDLGLGSLVLAAALAGSPAARACGYHDPSALNLGMLNLAYPDALFVRTAVWMAQRDGVIAGDLATPGDGQAPPTRGSADRLFSTLAALGQLRERLQVALDGHPQPSFSMVLMKPMLWSRFEIQGASLNLQAHAVGPTASDVVIVSDEPVVEALLSGRISPQDAQARGLVRLYGVAADVTKVSALLGRLTAERTATAPMPDDATPRSP